MRNKVVVAQSVIYAAQISCAQASLIAFDEWRHGCCRLSVGPWSQFNVFALLLIFQRFLSSLCNTLRTSFVFTFSAARYFVSGV